MAMFDFTTGALPAGATLARAAGPWSRTTRAGVMEAGNAADMPRFDYDPVTGAALGLFVEPAATNLLIRSREFGGSPWDASNAVSVDTDVVASPFGTVDAERLNFPGGQALARLQTTVDATSKPATVSLYTRAASGLAAFRLILNGYSPAIAPVATWARSSFTSDLLPAGGNIGIVNGPAGGVGSIYISAMQVEAGPRATSYIPTTTAPATRPAETLTLDWSSQGIADGRQTIAFTFGDGTTQAMTVTVLGGKTVIPGASLIRSALKYADILVTPPGRTVTLRDTGTRQVQLR